LNFVSPADVVALRALEFCPSGRKSQNSSRRHSNKMGLSLWNLFKVRRRDPGFEKEDVVIHHHSSDSYFCLLIIIPGRFAAGEFGHDFESKAISGQVWFGRLDQHGWSREFSCTSANCWITTRRPVSESSRDCLQRHNDCL
jgi:hypothetical protein